MNFNTMYENRYYCNHYSFGEKDVYFYVINSMWFEHGWKMVLIIPAVPLTHDELEEMKKAPRVRISHELLTDESKEGEVIKVIQSLSSVTFSLRLRYGVLFIVIHNSSVSDFISSNLAIQQITTYH